MSSFNYEKDPQGIVTLTMDMAGPVNTINAEYQAAMQESIDRLEHEPALTGVILASAKKVFVAGADLNALVCATAEQSTEIYQNIVALKRDLRRLEKLPVPVVAAINGAALGGGYELCLACNYRIALNEPEVRIGFPEVALGLFPASGGVVRLTHLLGVEKALEIILGSQQMGPSNALARGLVDHLVASKATLIASAKEWIFTHQSDADAAVQPWDRKGRRIPGGSIHAPRNAQYAAVAPAMLHKKTRGLMPNAVAAMDIAFQASILDVDTALRIESRAAVKIVTSAVAKNMITAFFFQLNMIKSGASRPAQVKQTSVRKLGVIGAGMMGQGIAYVAAAAGVDVVLKDKTQDAADAGKTHAEKLVAKQLAKGKLDTADADAILASIVATTEDEHLVGCDLIIEAVFENMALKNSLVATTEHCLAADGFWGSNTSTLPITQLAEASVNPERFIGIHFFSPVDKMPLVEIIAGEKTSDEALSKAFDFARQIGKIPIVVNDSLGFFTSRTFSSYLDEGAQLLVEGVHPIRIENLGKATGMPLGPLQVQDETSLELSRKISETWAAMGVADQWGSGETQRRVVKDMITDNGRGGRHHGGGFYEYFEDGTKTIWSGLYDLYFDPKVVLPDKDISDRLMFRQVIETLKCYQSGVLRSVADANIGSIMGIGAPAHTGGFIQFVNTYGFEAFIMRCDELMHLYGDRFSCPDIVRQRAASGELFT